MVHQISQCRCAVRTHGEGNESDREDRCTARVPESYQQQARHDVGEEAEELPHERRWYHILFHDPVNKK